MTSSGLRFLISILLIPGSLFMMRITGWFGLLFLASLVSSILFCFDYAGELRSLQKKTKYQKVISTLLFLPQTFFALVAISIGTSIVLWVLYNTFIQKLPEYSGGFLTFGIAPALVFYGLVTLKSISISKKNEKKP